MLLEKFLTAYNGDFGGTNEIFVNPTSREIREIKKVSRGNLRFIADKKNKKVYIFPVRSLHKTTWDYHIAPETKDSRKMYADGTLFGGALDDGRVVNWGFQDNLYKPDILAEWILNPEEWKFASKWFDIQGWIEDQKESLERFGARSTK